MPGAIKYLRKRFKTNASGLRIGNKNGNLTHIATLEQNTVGTVVNTVAVSPDGKNLYCFWNNTMKFYGIDQNNGQVFPLSTTGAGMYVGNNNGTNMVFSPDGLFLYCMGWTGGIYIWSRDPVTGFLTYVQQVANASAPVVSSGNLCCMRISPDGNQIYYSTPTTMRVLTRDAGTGLLTLYQTHAMSYGSQCTFAVTPDGGSLYWTSPNGQYSTGIYRYNRYGDGSLEYVDRITAPSSSIKLAVSKDSKSVYALGVIDSAPIKRFSRDLSGGALTYIDGLATVGTPGTFADMTISPDGVSLYQGTGNSAGSVMNQYTIDGTTGALTYVTSYSFTIPLNLVMANNNYAYMSANPMIQFSRS